MSGSSSLLLLLLLILGCAASSMGSATKLYLFNNSQVVPGAVRLIEFDTETKSYDVVASDASMMGEADAVSASIVCGQNYYAIWADVPVSSGILSLNLKTKTKMNYHTNPSGTIFHALACGSNSSMLKAVATVAGDPLTIHVLEVDMATGEAAEIGAFPSSIPFVGYDNMFKFTSDGRYVQLQASNNNFAPKVTSGSLYVMDTTSGKVEGPYSYPDGVGMPYDLFRLSNDDDSFTGSFLNGKTGKLSFCSLSKGADSISVSACKVTPALLSGSIPMPICSDGNLYVTADPFKPGNPQKLQKIDIKSGEVTEICDLKDVMPFPYVGSVFF